MGKYYELTELCKEAYIRKDNYASISQVTTSSPVAIDDVIREKFKEIIGEDIIDYKAVRKHQAVLFEILEETIDVNLGTVIMNQFDSLAETKEIALGDGLEFIVEDPDLLRASRISSGNGDQRRQKQNGKKFFVPTDYYGVKIYAEFEAFLKGEVNWTALIDKVAKSFVNHMGTMIYEGIEDGFSKLGAKYRMTGAYDEEKMLEMAMRIATRTGKQVGVYGTNIALRKISKGMIDFASDEMKNDMNKIGYLGNIAGIPLYALPNAFKPSTDDFVLGNNQLLLIPSNEKIVKVVIEGNAVVVESTSQESRNDFQIEYDVQKKYGVGVLPTKTYGVIEIN